uniref:Uncharacterized protein n=1 Tax=Caenorhabditis tropicalis TaxID=1561998 RepID=A0A1I7TTM4_9PELO
MRQRGFVRERYRNWSFGVPVQPIHSENHEMAHGRRVREEERSRGRGFQKKEEEPRVYRNRPIPRERSRSREKEIRRKEEEEKKRQMKEMREEREKIEEEEKSDESIEAILSLLQKIHADLLETKEKNRRLEMRISMLESGRGLIDEPRNQPESCLYNIQMQLNTILNYLDIEKKMGGVEGYPPPPESPECSYVSTLKDRADVIFG